MADTPPMIPEDTLELTSTSETPAPSTYSLSGDEMCDELRRLVVNEPARLESYKPMRVVLVQTAMGYKPPSGGYRGNYATLVALAKYGHETMQFCWAFDYEIAAAREEIVALGLVKEAKFDSGKVNMLDEDLKTVEVNWWSFVNPHGVLCVALNAAIMRIVYPNPIQATDAAQWIETDVRPARAKPYAKWIAHNIKKFEPTHVLFNDAFASKVSLEMKKLKDKIARVEIVHTLEQLPTGPYSGGVSGGCQTAHELTLWQNLDGIVAVSKAVQKYAEHECDLVTEMIPNHAWSYKDKETGAWPQVRYNFAKKNVVMINPAHMKGYSIFLGMARENDQRKVTAALNPAIKKPVYNFHAYISWGIRDEIQEGLEKAGVIMHKAVANMEPVYDEMSVLVVPSLWQEAWGLVATEAQIRGIPVIAADIGGLPEAKRFVPPFVKVNAIDGTKRDTEGNYLIPVQHARPWIVELDKLLDDEDRYKALSAMSYYTTRQWLRDFDVRHMEKYLLSVMK